MTLDSLDQQLITIIQGGFELINKPFARIAAQIGVSEQVVLDRLAQLNENGTIKRMGVVVRHRELGFTANAMVVWDIPDQRVDEIAQRIASFDCVTLCYQRPRRMPDWSYNLFSMIHGKDRDFVLQRLADIVDILELQNIKHTPLFSTRQFKQRGAHYFNKQSFANNSFESINYPVAPLLGKNLINNPSIAKLVHQDKTPVSINHAYG
ncbi:MAG: AsnC family protein [gamma proteobacterium symbiont of Taylorina sp.]|nr:AsnC family protein [gamma proteobacterium symbiont of Taylorina sp.]